MTRILLVTLLMLVAAALPAAAQSYEELNAVLVDEVVVPAYERYAAAIGRLPASIEPLCARPGQERLEAAQQVWRAAMLAWQHAQPITFGPVADLGLAPQIEFGRTNMAPPAGSSARRWRAVTPRCSTPVSCPEKASG